MSQSDGPGAHVSTQTASGAGLSMYTHPCFSPTIPENGGLEFPQGPGSMELRPLVGAATSKQMHRVLAERECVYQSDPAGLASVV